MSVASLLLFLACASDPREGTAVGNPTNMGMDVAAASDAKVAAATVEVGSVRGWTCDGVPQDVPVAARVDLVGGGTVPVPGVPLCALAVVFGGPLQLDLAGADQQVAVSLPVDAVHMRSEVPVETAGGVLRLGAPGWISLLEARDVALGDTDTESAVVARLVGGAVLVRDADRDGADDTEEPVMVADPVGEADAGGASASDDDDGDADDGASTPGAAGRANGINRGNGNGGNGNGN
jgi:hypothetical protein